MKSSHLKRKSEARLYEPVKKALYDAFKPMGKCYLEVTSRSVFSEKLKSSFTDFDLFVTLFERYAPDIMGFIEESEYSKPLIVVEVKPSSIRIKDIFQVKEYAEVFNARYALLISPQPLPEEIKRIVKTKMGILCFFPERRVFIGEFSGSSGQMNEFGWYPEKLSKQH